MLVLRQSTAVDVLIGPFVDKTDGITAETGESPSVKLSKNGQALAAKNDVTTPVSDADGYYNCEFDATDTNTVGTLVLSVAASANAAPVRHEFQVVEEAVYDAMYASGAVGPLEANDNGSGLTEAGGTGDHLSALPLNDPTAATIAAAVWDLSTSGHTTAGTFGQQVKTDIDAILVDTAEIGAAGAGLTAVPWNASWDAEVQSECTDALNAYDPPTKAEMDTGFAAVPTATENADALLNRDMSAVSDTNGRSPLNALRFLRNKWSVSGTTLTVTKEDDSTSAWTATVTTDATADPITGNDPA